MHLQQLTGRVRKAVDEFHMINEGDTIAVGISGGKDSLAMLYALSSLQRYYPVHFDLQAIQVDLGFKDMPSILPIKALCEELGVNYTCIHSDIAEIVFNLRKEDNPCSLCAKLRKGALNEAAKSLGCNKVAYAHHKDDIVETFMMSLIYEGRLHSFAPVTYLDRMELTVIRPMMYVNEADIIGFKNIYNPPVIKNPCPADGYTKREYTKDLIRSINADSPGVKERMFTAILEGLYKKS